MLHGNDFLDLKMCVQNGAFIKKDMYDLFSDFISVKFYFQGIICPVSTVSIALVSLKKSIVFMETIPLLSKCI